MAEIGSHRDRKIELEVPRPAVDLRSATQRRFPAFDQKIVSMYARGMSVREIQGHLRDLYGVDVSADHACGHGRVLEEIAE